MIHIPSFVKQYDMPLCSALVYGVVLVSTGFLKSGKPLVDWDHVKTQNLKLNANDNLAYAA